MYDKRSADCKVTAMELDEIIRSSEQLQEEVKRKQEVQPAFITRVATLVTQLAVHMKALRMQRDREEAQDKEERGRA